MNIKASIRGIIPALRSKAITALGGSFFSDEENQIKLPVFPEWFFSARLGQPRQSNLLEVRTFAKSPWIQIAINTIKKEVNQVPHKIVLTDENSEEDISKYKKEVDIVENFFKDLNSNHETIEDLQSPVITDLGEIDAGTWIKVYSTDSYSKELVTVYDEHGRDVGQQEKMVLKPFGQRELVEMWYADGATFLIYIDIFRRIQGYYQYTFKNPRANPVFFDKNEVVYFMLNRRSYTLYGYSPTQACQQEVELMMQSTRYNKDFFTKNMIPDGLVGIEDASDESLIEAKDAWAAGVQGKPHKLLFINGKINFQQLNAMNKDMEWLKGQQWYFHIIFAQFGMSPVEVGFHEGVNRSAEEGQERITVKNAIKPYLELFQNKINTDIITELLQDENPPIKWKYTPKDHSAEKIEFEQAMKEIELGTMTPNEYRKSRGRDDIEGGDETRQQQQSITFNGNNDPNKPENAGKKDEKDKGKPKPAKPNKDKKTDFASKLEKFISTKKNV